MSTLQIIEAIAVVPTLFLLIIIAFQCAILLFIPKKKIYEKKVSKKFRPSISILIPAHNEGKFLEEVLNSILNCGYEGKKEIIVIDDGSTDNTPEIVEEFKKRKLIKSIRTNHIGKSKALNKGIKVARNEIIITMDGDSRLEKGSLEKLVAPLFDRTVAATTGVIKVENTSKPLSWFQKLEYLNFAFFKSACERISAVIATSGPLSAFRKKYLIGVGGFSQYTYLEDFDVALKLIKNGYKTHFVDDAFCYTYVPDSLLELAKQRLRWTRGGAQIIKMHSDMYLNKYYKGPGLYSLPILSYWYFHSVLMGIALTLQIILGYNSFFLIKGVVFSFDVAKYFFNWFSVFGIINLSYQILIGYFPLALLSILNITVMILTYMIIIYSMKKFREKITIKDVIALIFMFPYWFFVMIVQIYSNAEWFKSKSKNWWKK